MRASKVLLIGIAILLLISFQLYAESNNMEGAGICLKDNLGGEWLLESSGNGIVGSVTYETVNCSWDVLGGNEGLHFGLSMSNGQGSCCTTGYASGYVNSMNPMTADGELSTDCGHYFGAVKWYGCEDGGANQCPSATPYRCQDGSCVINTSDCGGANQCPQDTPFRCQNGSCVANISDCGGSNNNQCPQATPFKCQNGSCVANISDCGGSNNNQCPQATPFKCQNGSCVANISDCGGSNNNQCPQATPFKCQNGSCVANISDCGGSNNNQCPQATPFKCQNGSCVANISDCGGSNIPLY